MVECSASTPWRIHIFDLTPLLDRSAGSHVTRESDPPAQPGMGGAAQAHAIGQRYCFYSYGDASLLLP